MLYNIYIYIHTYTCMYVCMYIYIYIYMYTCIHISYTKIFSSQISFSEVKTASLYDAQGGAPPQICWPSGEARRHQNYEGFFTGTSNATPCFIAYRIIHESYEKLNSADRQVWLNDQHPLKWMGSILN